MKSEFIQNLLWMEGSLPFRGKFHKTSTQRYICDGRFMEVVWKLCPGRKLGNIGGMSPPGPPGHSILCSQSDCQDTTQT